MSDTEIKKIDSIVLDMDEHLVNSKFAGSTTSYNHLITEYGDKYPHIVIDLGDGERYVTFLRSWTRDLIQFCFTLVGRENVFILSTGIISYVKQVNRDHALGILDENIYGREDIRFNSDLDDKKAHPRFKDRNSILLDNENYYYHSCGSHNKTKFLQGLAVEKFLEVPDFEVEYFDPKDDEGYLEILQDNIVRALAH